ncbi:MAG: HAD family hydrolase [Candidatus Bathyarchaeota archaeon]|nr:HAD family hydrolase [Candidatus Bathyarchaeota archaeon]
MSREKIKGIIFDLDGTLIRSSIDFPGMKRRMIAVLEDHGIPRGLLSPTETTVAILAEAERIWEELEIPHAEREQAQSEVEEAMNQTELEAIPTVEEVEGAAEAIRCLREMGYRLAVLTRGHQAYAVEALSKAGMIGYFELILGRGETTRPKPHAEALRNTADLMGLGMDEVLFVGDHTIDATCAENACISFIAVLSGLIKEEGWAEHGQKTILGSVRDLTGYLAER